MAFRVFTLTTGESVVAEETAKIAIKDTDIEYEAQQAIKARLEAAGYVPDKDKPMFVKALAKPVSCIASSVLLSEVEEKVLQLDSDESKIG